MGRKGNDEKIADGGEAAIGGSLVPPPVEAYVHPAPYIAQWLPVGREVVPVLEVVREPGSQRRNSRSADHLLSRS